jgi:3-dehydroquinate dehydratase II
MAPRVLVLHGPNLNLIADLQEIDERLDARSHNLGVEVKTFQANSEGSLVDALHAERTKVSGIIINAGKLAPHAEVLAETVALLKRPTFEVLFEGAMKQKSALKGVVLEQLAGPAEDVYERALEKIARSLSSLTSRPTAAIDMTRLTGPSMTVTDDMADTGPIVRAELMKKSMGKKPPQGDINPTELIVNVKKTIGKVIKAKDRDKEAPAGALSRETVRNKISERLSGKLTPAGLATWARSQWQQIQRGAPVESGQRDRLEDVLQTLLLSTSTKANDHQLIELMTQLG